MCITCTVYLAHPPLCALHVLFI